MAIDQGFNVKVRVVNRQKCAISGAPVMLELLPESKNIYVIGVRITNEDGEVEFERSEIDQQIQVHQREFPMDYSGSIHECSAIRVSVLGSSDVWKYIKASEIYKDIAEWHLDDAYKNHLKGACRSFRETKAQVYSAERASRGQVEIMID